jgi:predicted Zn-dependent protease
MAEAPDATGPRRQLAGILVRSGDPKGAELLVQQGLRIAPADPALQQALTALLMQSQGVDAALAAADRLSKQPTARPASLSLPGDVLMGANRAEDAAKAYVSAYREVPSSLLALRQAAAWKVAGKPNEGMAVLADWLQRKSDDVGALVLASELDIAARRLPDAERRLRAALVQAPQDAAVLNNLAWVAGEQGSADAQPLAERAYLLAPNAETADTLGWIMVRKGDAAQAVPVLKRAAAMRGNTPDPAATYRLSYALNATGAKQEARAVLEPVLATDAKFPEREAAVRLLASLRGGR